MLESRMPTTRTFSYRVLRFGDAYTSERARASIWLTDGPWVFERVHASACAWPCGGVAVWRYGGAAGPKPDATLSISAALPRKRIRMLAHPVPDVRLNLFEVMRRRKTARRRAEQDDKLLLQGSVHRAQKGSEALCQRPCAAEQARNEAQAQAGVAGGEARDGGTKAPSWATEVVHATPHGFVLPEQSQITVLMRGPFHMNPDGTPNTLTLHEGMDVVEGTKYIVTKWFREGSWLKRG